MHIKVILAILNRNLHISGLRALLVFLTVFVFLPDIGSCEYSELRQRLERIAKPQKNARAGIHVIDLSSGAEVYSSLGKEPLKPASTQKILTSVAALEILGPQHHFQTKVSLARGKDGKPDLYIKGLGDPSLTTEALWLIARRIKKLGIRKLNQIYYDDSAFVDPPQRDGQRAYMASPSALPFNFNSIAIEVCPEIDNKLHVSSDPWEVPVKINADVQVTSRHSSALQVNEMPAGNGTYAAFSVKGRLNPAQGCQAVYRSVDNPGRYFTATLQRFITYLGIDVEQNFAKKNMTDEDSYGFINESQPLSWILRGLNHYSTNFVAEQILYALGADADASRFSREKGKKKLESVLLEEGISSSMFNVDDGSGLSHANRLPANALTKLLFRAYHNPRYSGDFLASLPAAGYSGTMKKRFFPPPGSEIRAKTGSLDGVISLAGYVLRDGKPGFAFAILQNGVSSREQAILLEERIIQTLSNS